MGIAGYERRYSLTARQGDHCLPIYLLQKLQSSDGGDAAVVDDEVILEQVEFTYDSAVGGIKGTGPFNGDTNSDCITFQCNLQ